MTAPRRLIALIAICLLATQSSFVAAQGLKLEPVTKLAATDTGLIEGKVTDELGKPLDGAVISALGGTTAFAVSVPPKRSGTVSTMHHSDGFDIISSSFRRLM